MSRKSVIQLMPAPTGRGDASDLRYRLLMAALGSGEEENPLLSGGDAAAHPYDIDAEAEVETLAESAPIHANQNVAAREPRPVEGLTVADLESHTPALSLVRPQAPAPSQPVRNTGSVMPGPAGATPLQRPPKQR